MNANKIGELTFMIHSSLLLWLPGLIPLLSVEWPIVNLKVLDLCPDTGPICRTRYLVVVRDDRFQLALPANS